MKETVLPSFTISCLLSTVFLIALAFNIQPAKAFGTIIVPDDYPTIQEAVNAASLGDTISVKASIYYENVVVDKRVSLVGEDVATTIIDGGGSGTVVDITVDRVNVTGFTIRSGYYNNAGIYLDAVSYCNITGNNITANQGYGIWLDSSSNNTIGGNNITNNCYGISLKASSNNTISGNNITSNTSGISLYGSSNYNNMIGNNITNNHSGVELSYSSNNTVSVNDIAKNYFGVRLHSDYNSIVRNNITASNSSGIRLSSSYNRISGNVFVNDGLTVYNAYGNVVEDNSVNGKPMVYLEEASDYVVEDAGQVVLVNCNRITVKNLNLSNTAIGVQLWETTNTELSGNTIANNRYGVELYESSYNNISINNITNNDYGVYLYKSSDYNNLIGNNITANEHYGVWLYESSNNTLSGNVMKDNECNMAVSGYKLSAFMHSIDVSNLVNGKSVYYLVNQKDLLINPLAHPQVGFLAFVNCTNVTVEGLRLANNEEGILLVCTNNSRIASNTITNNDYGVGLLWSSNNTVSGNNITNTDCGVALGSASNNNISANNVTKNNYGIMFDGASNNSIVGNNIAANHEYGIWLGMSSNNTIFHNNLINNTNQVYITSPVYPYYNVWDDGYPSGGNYWCDYTDVDFHSGQGQNESGSDGIGDVPYEIMANDQDRYPIMAPIGFYDAGVSIASNSTISEFELNATGKTLSFNVTGPDLTAGFCRVAVPNVVVQDLWQGNYTVLLNGEPWPSRNWTDTTNTYIYINYTHSQHEVIIREFPSPDTAPPSVSVLSPENKTYGVKDVSLTFIVSESTSWIGYSLDGQANVTITQNTTLTGLSDGSHSLIVCASDTAGNMGYSDMVHFTIDTTPPSISIESPENETYATTDIPLTFTVDESVSWMAYSLDGQANMTISGNTTLSGLSEGSHSLTIYAEDTTGNAGASGKIYFTVETQPSPLWMQWWFWVAVVLVALAIAGAAYFLKRR